MQGLKKHVQTQNIEGQYGRSAEDGKEKAEWATGWGNGCLEWMTVPKDLRYFVVRLNTFPLLRFSSLHPWLILIHLGRTATLKI